MVVSYTLFAQQAWWTYSAIYHDCIHAQNLHVRIILRLVKILKRELRVVGNEQWLDVCLRTTHGLPNITIRTDQMEWRLGLFASSDYNNSIQAILDLASRMTVIEEYPSFFGSPAIEVGCAGLYRGLRHARRAI